MSTTAGTIAPAHRVGPDYRPDAQKPTATVSTHISYDNVHILPQTSQLLALLTYANLFPVQTRFQSRSESSALQDDSGQGYSKSGFHLLLESYHSTPRRGRFEPSSRHWPYYHYSCWSFLCRRKVPRQNLRRFHHESW